MTSTLRARLAGLAATVAIIGIVAGMPLLLLAVGPNPLHASLPTLAGAKDALTAPDDGTLALAAIAAIGWAAWVVLTLAVAVEILAAARRLHPPRLPGLTLPQTGARTLVSTAILLFAATPASIPLAAPPAHATPVAAAPATSPAPQAPTPTTSAAAESGSVAPQAADEPTPPERTVRHTVRRGDSLWSLAAAHLGSGRRYREIVALNRDLLGDHPGFLRPGWRLTLPAPAHTAAPELVTVHPGDTLSQIALDHLGHANRYPQIAAASRTLAQPGGEHLTDPDHIEPGWTILIPAHPATTAKTSNPVPSTARRQPTPAASRTAVTRPSARPHPELPDDTSPPASAPTDRAHTGRGTTRTRDQAHATAADQHLPSWVLTGLTGGGAILAGSAYLTLRRRRRIQHRTRRPGRTIPTPPTVVVPVEKTLTAIGGPTAPTITRLDTILRRLASALTAHGHAIPPLRAVQLASTGLTLHLAHPAPLPPPWTRVGDERAWTVPADIDPDLLAAPDADQPAPYPLLVTIGSTDDGQIWLLNAEHAATLTLTGDPTYATDLARYLAAELAVNPWSEGIRVDCIGVAAEIEPMNPHRVRHHDTPATEALADATAMIERTSDIGVDAATGRGTRADEDLWPARLLLLDAAHASNPAVTALRDLIAAHPGRTATALIVNGDPDTASADVVATLTPTGRVHVAALGLDLVAVGLTSDEATGCATLLAHADLEGDQPIPADQTATAGWRALTDDAGSLRSDHALARDDHTDSVSLLHRDDDDYTTVAATTGDDLQALAPRVTATTRAAAHDADPTLDEDLVAWHNPDCPRPRLTLLGPVHARTNGDPRAAAKRKPYATELLAYLATRPRGATPAELADAFTLTANRVRVDMTMLRDWLGTNPVTGTPHLPNARKSPAARTRGTAVYEVQDVLLDADLFRRLRLRGQTRGPDGLSDLQQALNLVQGPPFDQLRPAGWAWLADSDRLDQHIICAIIDVAHTLTTAHLANRDHPAARAAAELACRAAPYEEIPRLDLAAVAAAEGHHHEAERIAREDICNRTDDNEPPTDLSDRTDTVLKSHKWLEPNREAS